MIFCVSLMAHNSTHFLFIWVCKLRCFLTEERRKEKGALLTEVLFVSDCPQKNKKQNKWQQEVLEAKEKPPQPKTTTSISGKDSTVGTTLLGF